MLYLVFVALALATTGALIFSLVGKRQQNLNADRSDIDLYRAQLAELNDEEDSNLISSDDAASARLEIERRLLRALDRESGLKSRPLTREIRTLTAAGLLVLIPFMAAGLYISLGSPDLPGQRPAPESASLENASMDELLEKLAIRLTDNPDDLEGWLLMGRSAQNLGRFKLAIRAYENAIRLSPNAPGLYAGLGQSMVGNEGGLISPAARAAFETALTLKPDNPISRYYLGLADYQSGQYLRAYHRWTDLAADTPPDAPWAEPLQSGIASAQAKLEASATPLPPTPSSPRGPTAEDMKAAQQMSAEDRTEMIRGMVEGLAARLEETPDDLQGWLRLGRAYGVLGETDKAIDAYDQVERLDPGNAIAKQALQNLRGE